MDRTDRIEDATMYGEFVPSYYKWKTPEQQKEIARYLETITQKPEQM